MEYETYETEEAYDDMNAREGSKTKVKAGKPEQEFDEKDSEKSKVETGNQRKIKSVMLFSIFILLLALVIISAGALAFVITRGADIDAKLEKLEELNHNHPLADLGSQLRNEIDQLKIEMAGKQDACPKTWTSLGTGCYLFILDHISWEQARDTCHQNDGFLAEIESTVEHDTLMEAIACKGWGDTAPLLNVHIGLTKKEDQWQWDNSGKTISSCSSRWYPGQPSGDGSCAGFFNPKVFGSSGNLTEGLWNDYSCTEVQGPFGAICEI